MSSNQSLPPKNPFAITEQHLALEREQERLDREWKEWLEKSRKPSHFDLLAEFGTKFLGLPPIDPRDATTPSNVPAQYAEPPATVREALERAFREHAIKRGEAVPGATVEPVRASHPLPWNDPKPNVTVVRKTPPKPLLPMTMVETAPLTQRMREKEAAESAILERLNLPTPASGPTVREGEPMIRFTEHYRPEPTDPEQFLLKVGEDPPTFPNFPPPSGRGPDVSYPGRYLRTNPPGPIDPYQAGPKPAEDWRVLPDPGYLTVNWGDTRTQTGPGTTMAAKGRMKRANILGQESCLPHAKTHPKMPERSPMIS